MALLARTVRSLARPAHSRLLRSARPQRAQAPSTLPRTLSTAAVALDDEAEWAAAFVDATSVFSGEDTHEASAQRMRALVKSGLLRHTDLRDRPDRFFEAHRLLARRAVSEGPGFWIRFTVHYNLCYGTVLAVGNDDQIAALDDVEAEGRLGCFALTERRAGVQSGLVVKTTATYDAATQEFVLNSPSQGAYKNWISQGHVADDAVVLASLTVGAERVGPHAFLVDMASAGISTGDMGVKTTGNDLDNAWIGFDGVRVPRSALLDAHCSVSAEGTYARTTKLAPFEMIGQRLYTDRVAVAQAALAFRRQVYEVTKAYAREKPIPDVAGRSRVLADIPQLKALFKDAAERADALEAFVGTCEDRLAPLLKTGAVPDADLALAIATAKVRAVEDSIDACWKLKQEVGSYALMGDSGFKHLDFLNCCKFAEGDSRVLAQKMARDTLRVFAKNGDAGDAASTRLAGELAKALKPAAGDKVATADLWDANFETVYALADAVMDRVVAEA